jgi:hypothetical protein
MIRPRPNQAPDTEHRYIKPGGPLAAVRTLIPPTGASWEATKDKLVFLVTLSCGGGLYIQPVCNKRSLERIDKTFTTVEGSVAELTKLGYTTLRRIT